MTSYYRWLKIKTPCFFVSLRRNLFHQRRDASGNPSLFLRNAMAHAFLTLCHNENIFFLVKEF